MKKQLLESFIKRYSLGGLITKVKWKYTPATKTLHTRSVIEGRSFLADVILNNFDDMGSDDIAICIGDSERVLSMLSPFGEYLTLNVNKVGERILGMSLSDADCECYCTAADPASIDPVPKNIQDIPEFQVEVPLTPEFIEKFRKAHSALKEVDSFTVATNKKGLFEVVIGYTTSNSNRIRLTPVTDPVKNTLGTPPISFPIKNIIELLKANSDIDTGLLSINNSGIIKVSLKNDTYASTYYQFCNKKQ